jgi:hypothetical protein
VSVYKPFKFNGVVITDARKPWNDQVDNQTLVEKLPQQHQQEHVQQTPPAAQQQQYQQQQLVPTQAAQVSQQQQQKHQQQQSQQRAQPPATLQLGPSLKEASAAPETPRVRHSSRDSERSQSVSVLSDLRSSASRRFYSRDEPLYYLTTCPFVTNMLLISNTDDSCCWLPVGDDWVISPDGISLSSRSLNKQGKVRWVGPGFVQSDIKS